ncbi:DcaP family trimeric outer membrane transporter [Telmatospirillum sp.]|uniref:DcaP family trimeric outer membrane transporter n=1 Tax=Telmatospirillum sp. TaxID=2079197 RepID=UPI002848EB3C|nr:DcaP family trimeric outer membrane transporter [Telmatospirillum sp.]MDR3437423.1 DcaP family trimeric outer membrane transporter [Telmatospirillum sp.]
MAFNKTQLLSVLALGVGAAISPVPAHADEVSDLKALVNELKNQVLEQRAQVKDLRTQLNDLNSQVKDQKKQVSDQSAQVQNQNNVLQKVEAQQQVLEKKQAAVPVQASASEADAVKPGYFAIPGTKTAFKIGGYVKLDVVDDVSSNLGASAFTKTATDFTAIPLDHSQAANRSGQVNFTAQESRLNLTALTKSEALGEVKTVLEGDFYNVGSGNLFRLRHAYVSGGGFLAGQTWSTFADLETGGPETLDFNGPVGWAATRQPQLRYTAKLPTGNLDLAIESPSGDLTSTATDYHIDKAPDVVVRYTVDPSWGHFAVAGLGRYLASDSGLPGKHPDSLVYGVLAGIGIKTVGKDTLVFQTVDGNGIGRYLEQGQGISAVLVNNEIKPINIWGGTVGYTHFWTDALRSNVAYGYGHFGTPNGDAKLPIKSLTSVHANLIWSPWTATDVGLEYIYGHLETSTPQLDAATKTTASQGSASRVEGSVKYTF